MSVARRLRRAKKRAAQRRELCDVAAIMALTRRGELAEGDVVVAAQSRSGTSIGCIPARDVGALLAELSPRMREARERGGWLTMRGGVRILSVGPGGMRAGMLLDGVPTTEIAA